MKSLLLQLVGATLKNSSSRLFPALPPLEIFCKLVPVEILILRLDNRRTIGASLKSSPLVRVPPLKYACTLVPMFMDMLILRRDHRRPTGTTLSSSFGTMDMPILPMGSRRTIGATLNGSALFL